MSSDKNHLTAVRRKITLDGFISVEKKAIQVQNIQESF